METNCSWRPENQRPDHGDGTSSCTPSQGEIPCSHLKHLTVWRGMSEWITSKQEYTFLLWWKHIKLVLAFNSLLKIWSYTFYFTTFYTKNSYDFCVGHTSYILGDNTDDVDGNKLFDEMETRGSLSYDRLRSGIQLSIIQHFFWYIIHSYCH